MKPQRIENWWNFLKTHCATYYRALFQAMERFGVLDRCRLPICHIAATAILAATAPCLPSLCNGLSMKSLLCMCLCRFNPEDLFSLTQVFLKPLQEAVTKYSNMWCAPML